MIKRNVRTIDNFVTDVPYSVIDVFHLVVNAVRDLQTLCSSHAGLLLSQFIEPPQRVLDVCPSY